MENVRFQEPYHRPATLGEWAAYYAASGLHVFPLVPRTKEPFKYSHGLHDATTDAEQVRRWWNQNPNANIGIACGPSGLLVIDCDVHPERNVDGLATLYGWEREHGELIETLVAITGSGSGQHLYYLTDTNVTSSKDDTEDKHVGIDIRAQGGYVVAPPSVYSTGRIYEFEAWPWDEPPTVADEDVLEFVRWVQEESKRNKDGDDVGLVLPDIIKEGGRDDTLFKLAAKLRTTNVPEDAALACLRETNKQAVPPLPDNIVVAKLRSAYDRYSPGTTRQRINGTVPVLVRSCSHGMTPAKYRDWFEGERIRGYHVNDRELGQLFARLHRDVVAYVPEAGSFAAYDGSRWVFDGAEQIVDAMVKAFILGLELYAATIEDDHERKAMREAAGRYDGHSKRKGLREDLKPDVVRHLDEFDKSPNLLNVADKTIEFVGPGKVVVRHQDPADLITKVAPVRYDPDATCPLFERTMAEALEGDVETIEFVRRLFGIICAGDTSLDRFYLAGTERRAGKGTLFGSLLAMLGTDEASGYGVMVQPETFGTKTFSNSSGPSSDRARLEGKRLILTSELSERITLDSAFLKACTGGDLIAARKMRRNERQFSLSGSIVLLTNRFPTIEDDSIFTSGRAVAIPFDHHVPAEERDLMLRSRLRDPAELSGLLNWCIGGYDEHVHDLDLPEAVLGKTRAFLAQSDDVGRYVDECLEKSDGVSVPASALYEDFLAWSGSGKSMGRNEFYRLLAKHVPISPRATVGDRRMRNVVVGWQKAATGF